MCHIAVTQHLRHNLDVRPVRKVKRGAGVSKVVEPDDRQARPFEEGPERASNHVRRVHRSSEDVREHQAEVVPTGADPRTVLGLSGPMATQGVNSDRRAVDRPTRRLRLRGDDLQALPWQTLEGVDDFELATVEVHGLPAKAEKLTLSKAGRNGHDEQRAAKLALRGLDQCRAGWAVEAVSRCRIDSAR